MLLLFEDIVDYAAQFQGRGTEVRKIMQNPSES